MSIIAFSSAIGPVPIDCVVSEKHTSKLSITSIAIETGAKISDHAVVEPKSVTLTVKDRGAAATYTALMAFQESRAPFTLVTGLSIYRNMLITAMTADRGPETAHILDGTVELQEVMIVDTAYAADPDGDTTGERGKAGGAKSTRAAPATPERAKDAVTSDRATGTVQSGDAGVKTVQPPTDQSLIRSIVGGGP